jgi:hypothetical protein
MLRRHLVLLFLLLPACATKMQSRAPSEYLMSTSRPATEVLSDIKSYLESSRYKIKKFDTAAGIIVVQPRVFAYNKNGDRSKAKQTIFIRLEGGSLKLRINYACTQDSDLGTYSVCYSTDQELQQRIQRLEGGLQSELAKLLSKTRQDSNTNGAETID